MSVHLFVLLLVLNALKHFFWNLFDPFFFNSIDKVQSAFGGLNQNDTHYEKDGANRKIQANYEEDVAPIAHKNGFFFFKIIIQPLNDVCNYEFVYFKFVIFLKFV